MNGEFLWRWGRGFSKTLLIAILSVFLSSLGLRGCIILPQKKQLDQLMQYLESCELLDFKGRDRRIGVNYWYSILDIPLIHLDIAGIQAINSGRFHYVVWDEAAQLVFEPRKEYYYDKGDGMFRSMPFAIKLTTSTPVPGSRFEKEEIDMISMWGKKCRDLYPQYRSMSDKDICILFPHPSCSWRNFENTPNNFVTNTPEKVDKLRQEREKLKRMGLEWIWLSENLAIYISAGGTVFTTAIYGSHQQQRFNRVGFDFHDYENGHITVFIYWNPKIPDVVYVTGERCYKYDENATASESLSFLNGKEFEGVELIAEDMGFNRGYYREALKWGMRSSNAILQKADLIANIFNFRIYIDPLLTPLTYNDVKNAQWKDPEQFEIRKESTGTAFRNHYLDALLNGVPPLSSPEYIRFIHASGGELPLSPYLRNKVRELKKRFF